MKGAMAPAPATKARSQHRSLPRLSLETEIEPDSDGGDQIRLVTGVDGAYLRQQRRHRGATNSQARARTRAQIERRELGQDAGGSAVTVPWLAVVYIELDPVFLELAVAGTIFPKLVAFVPILPPCSVDAPLSK
ncbi:hypothetical protein ABZP36_022567 [Zizania latifolia]